jgi:hypothetical protein
LAYLHKFYSSIFFQNYILRSVYFSVFSSTNGLPSIFVHVIQNHSYRAQDGQNITSSIAKELSAMHKLVLTLLLILCLPAIGQSADNPLAAWQPKFDPSGAKYTYIVSNVSHPVIEGVGVGYRIRDKVWEKSGGRLYVDFRPLSQLGGEIGRAYV